MFLEQCGKIFFSKMRPIFFFSLLISPLLFSLSYLFIQNNRFHELKDSFEMAIQKGKVAMDRKAKKERFLKNYSYSDPYFLDQQIESLHFLQLERANLEALLSHPALSKKGFLQDRLSFLDGAENRLSFIEENIQASSQIKETEEKQRHPVQMDEQDLQKLLSLIEAIPIGNYLPANRSPQLLIRDFKIKKQETPLKTSVFEVEMELFKREFNLP